MNAENILNNKNLDEGILQAAKLISSDIFGLFLRQGIDRCAFICQWLKANLIPHTVVNLAGKKHIIVKFNSKNYNPQFKMKTIVAHYDREERTEGANDNSAACFQLMYFAKSLSLLKTQHNIRIIFTDGEEAGSKGITEQGSFALGSGLKKLGMDKDDIFVFDMCGRGDCLIISQSGIYGRAKDRTQRLDELHTRACKYASLACPNQWISIPTAYSDNAGFVANGLTAQVITVLPRAEVDILLKHLPQNLKGLQNKSGSENEYLTGFQNELIDLIIKNKKPKADSPYKNIIPQTWQYMHTAQDTRDKLRPEAFVLTGRYLRALSN